jgi:hypothetical protein
MPDGREVGTIYRIDDEWLWSINLGMMEAEKGHAAGSLRGRR